MTSIPFDTYLLINNLKNRGFTEEQSRGVVEALQQVDMDKLVTKTDLATALSDAKFEILKWMFGGFMTVILLLVGVLLKIGG